MTVIHGDCLDVLKTLESGSIDLTVTSPPYDNLRTYNGYTFDFEGIAQELYRVTKDGGVVVWVVADATIKGSETGTSFRQALYFKECGFNLHDTMIWEKPTFTATGALRVRYGQVFEYMFVLSKGLPKTFNPIKDRKRKIVGNIRHGSVRLANGSFKNVKPKAYHSEHTQRFNVWHCPTVRHNAVHPAQFPEPIANDHIVSWSNPGDTVLDPFCGSGTTGKMAILNGRKFIGIEISDEYCEIARARIGSVYEKAGLHE